MSVKITRRRAITVLAAAAGLPLFLKAGHAQARVFEWQGTSLGASASIKLYHTDEAKARTAVEAAVAELNRLEDMFSLYRPNSVISRLNRDGSVDDAPKEFVELMSYGREVAEQTDGWFDPTVQPLWDLYFRHFTAETVDPAGPSPEAIRQALALVGWRGISIDGAAGRVALARPGMGVTHNALGQGYITDRVTDILRHYGFRNMLVNMGELQAVSSRPDGTAWRIGIADPADQSRAIAEVDVVDKGVATSGGYGTIFDPNGKFTHIIDPHSGRTAPQMLGVTVIADSATKANAYSTPLTLVPKDKRQAIVSLGRGIKAIFVTPDGVTETLEG